MRSGKRRVKEEEEVEAEKKQNIYKMNARARVEICARALAPSFRT